MGDMFYPGQKDYIKKLNQLASSGGAGASLSIGTVEEGDTAAATITGTAPDQKLNLTLPKGDKGDKGDAGDEGAKGDKGDKGDAGEQGPAGVTPRGGWSADAVYAVNDLATYAGSAWLRIVAGMTATTPDADAANWEIFVRAGADGSGGGGGTGTVSVTAPLTSTGGSNPTLGINAATESASGSMSAADKTKLDSVATGAAAVGNVAGAALGGASAGAAATAARSDHVHPLPTAANVGAVAASAVGAANGVAPLDSTGKVAAAYLPSYVDDVLEYANLAAFPATGETGKIYVADDSGKIYRWSGSAYIEISASPGSTDAVPEGATNQYFTPSRVLATVLTGLSTATNAVITAADTALSALGKLQKQISDFIAQKGAANGLATLGADGLVPTAQLPASSSGGAQTGDILYTARAPGSGYLKADGSVYAQSAYTALFSVLGILSQSQSGAFSAGVARTSGFGVVTINASCYGNGLYVVVGGGGKISTSPDGVNWTSQSSGVSVTLYGACYANSLFVAVGASGTVLTSPDGVTWTARTSGFGSTDIRGVCYGNGLFVAVGMGAALATSPDGITWTARTSGFGSSDIYCACYGNGLFVAAGTLGKLTTSPDGVTWTVRTSALSANIYGVCYGGGLFVGVTLGGTLATSPDGITWTARTISFGSSGLACVCYGNGLFVAGGFSAALGTSPDGITWTSRTSGFATASLNGICYANGLYVVVGGSGKLSNFYASSYDLSSQFIVPTLPSYAGAIPYIKT